MTLFADYHPRRNGVRNLPADLTIRPAKTDDLDALAAIALERQGGDMEDHRRRFANEVARVMAGEELLLLVAEFGGTVAGYARAGHQLPPPDAPPNAAPAGWYLSGVIVAAKHRRRGIGAELVRQRLEWIAARAREAFYFANARNQASIDLHSSFDFVEWTRDFWIPDTTFEGSEGILFRAKLG